MNNEHVYSPPPAVYPVWLSAKECEQLTAVWEHYGLLGSIADKIKAAYNVKVTQ